MLNHLDKVRMKIHHLHNHLKGGNKSVWPRLKIYLLGLLVFLVAFVAIVIFYAIVTLPNIDNIHNLVAAQSSVIMDRNGVVLYTIHGDENREIVPLSQISPYVPKAVMAIEDDQFYKHHGIDVGAIMKAICSEVHLCSQPRGGSTITQQYVKNTFLSSERTYIRKLKEIILALELESKYSKDEIMAMYLNRIPYGASVYGVEVAAQTFFGKPASELTLAEAAILAAIPKAPSYYSPYSGNVYVQVNLSEDEILKRNIRSEDQLVDFITKGLLGKTFTYGEGDQARSIYVKGRVDFVLERMQTLGYITAEQAKAALAEANAIQFKPFRENIIAPHFVMYVRQTLEDKYGKEVLEKGGLKITTTLDAKLQKFADDAVTARADDNEKNYNVSDEGLVSVNADTGEILSMVGSRDFWNDKIDGKVNVTLQPRLPGSSFKPIVYASAFLQGYAPSTVVYDVKTTFGGTYTPSNFDGTFLGPISFRNALGASRNIPAIKAAQLAGIPNVLDLARKMGLGLNQPDDWYGLSLAIGAGEVRPLDMALAYSVFANGGYKIDPVAILKVEDRSGNILEEYKPPVKRNLVLDPQVCYLINDVLSDNSSRPTDYWKNQLTVPGQITGAKTGTSNKKKDNINYPFDLWTIGYTRHLATAVWAGNADGSVVSLKADGLGVASYIWKSYMANATKGQAAIPFDRPAGITWVKVSKRSGKLPTENTPPDDVAPAVFASFSVPTQLDDSYKVVEIDQVSGKLATEYTPEGARVKKGYYINQDILPEWNAAVHDWAVANNKDEQPPADFDNVHTAQNTVLKPEITITSPVAGSTVSPPQLGVWVKINSPGGVSKVEYYLDDVLADTENAPPYSGNIQLASDLAKGSEHTVKTIVYDELFNSNQSSVTVKIGGDTTPPTVHFIYPTDGAKLTAGASVGVQADARDANGGINKVRFYLNGLLTKEDLSAPFNWQMTVPEVTGDYTLKAVAYDFAGNSESDSITIHVVQDEETMTGDSRLLLPRDNDSFDQGSQIVVKAFVSSADLQNLTEVDLLAKKEGQQAMQIAKINTGSDSKSSAYSVIWDSPPAGSYELYLKVLMKSGDMHFSKRVPIMIH